MTAQAGGRSKRVCRIILHARGGGVEGKESDVVVQILHHLPDSTSWYYGTPPSPPLRSFWREIPAKPVWFSGRCEHIMKGFPTAKRKMRDYGGRGRDLRHKSDYELFVFRTLYNAFFWKWETLVCVGISAWERTVMLDRGGRILF